MRPPPRIHILWLFTCLTWLNENTDARKNQYPDAIRDQPNVYCPIGFTLGYTRSNEVVCYKLKGPEKLEDKFRNCVGNLYDVNVYFGLRLPTTKKVLWAEYKALHDGGPFIEWSYTNRTSVIIDSMPMSNQFGNDNKLCLVIDPVSNLTSAGCDEMHFRYCIIEPLRRYDSDDEQPPEGCEDAYPGFWRMYSPSPVCISEKSKVRVTWKQALDSCEKINASLLSKGWMYSNYVSANKSHPLGSDIDVTSIDKEVTEEINYDIQKPRNWHYTMVNGSLRIGSESDIFYSVMCEKPVQLKNINMSLTFDGDDLILAVNDSIDIAHILCSDTLSKSVAILPLNGNKFMLFPMARGYYWCFHFDYNHYVVSESNRVLYVDRQGGEDLYSIKVQWDKRHFPPFTFALVQDTIDMLQRLAIMQLDNNILIKRVYFDKRTAVFHVNLTSSNVISIQRRMREFQGNLKVIKVKRAYICDETGLNVEYKQYKLGESAYAGCILYTCVGDFDEGVDWVETVADSCTTPKPDVEVTAAYNIDQHNTASLKRSTSLQFSEGFNETMPPEISYPDNSTLSPITPRPPPNNTTRPPNTTPPEEVTTEPYVTTDNSSGVDFVTTPDEVVTATTSPDVNTVTTPPDESCDSSSEEVTTSNAIITTTMHPSEQLEQVLNELDNLLLSNDTVSLANVSNALDQVNSVLDFQDGDLEVPGRLLQLLDELSSRVELDGQPSAKTVRGNIALLTADVSAENPIRGMRLAARATDTFDNDTFSFISEANPSNLQKNDTEAVVYLPASVLRTPRRVSFVTFRNELAFRSNLSINSRVFSVNVQNVTHFERGEVVDIHLSPIEPQPGRNLSRTCVYWQFTDNSSGYWDGAGCRLIEGAEGLLDTCRCTHLTHFAEVLVPRTVFSERNEAALEILTLIGCFLSVFGIVVIGITAALFRSWRRDYSNKIWLQLSVAILALILCFILAVLVDFRNELACMLVGVALHYSVLASFCWMLVAAVLSYRRLVLVFTRDLSHKLLRAAAFAWGLPCGIVGALLAARPRAYVRPFDELTPSAGFCYPTGLALWLSVYAPVCAILLVNWLLFGLILRSVFGSRNIQRHGDNNEALRCASVSCLLVFLFGLPWIFGLFAFNVVAAYLFTFTGTFQGFVLFLFFVVGNKKTRDLWLNKLKIKQTRKVPVTSSTYTSRGTGPGWRAGVGAGAGAEGTTIEARASKPRSLTSPDESRFS